MMLKIMKTINRETKISKAIQINQKEEITNEEIKITNEEFNKMKELIEQKERELVYMREHYQKNKKSFIEK